MHTHQFFTWELHSIENTTLLDTRSSTHMCNIVTEFYLYSIVYIIELHCVWTLDQLYEESYEWYVGSMTFGDGINHIIAGPQHSFANFQY